VRLIAESTLKNDRVDAETLARLVRIDPALVCPIRHRSEENQRLRGMLRVRRTLVNNRTACLNTARGLLRSFGYRTPGQRPERLARALTAGKVPEALCGLVAPLVATALELDEKVRALDQLGIDTPPCLGRTGARRQAERATPSTGTGRCELPATAPFHRPISAPEKGGSERLPRDIEFTTSCPTLRSSFLTCSSRSASSSFGRDRKAFPLPAGRCPSSARCQPRSGHAAAPPRRRSSHP
jgi:hypothetical protein